MDVNGINAYSTDRVVLRSVAPIQKVETGTRRNPSSQYQDFFLRQSLAQLRKAIEDLGGSLEQNRTVEKSGRPARAASVISTELLDLRTTATATTLASTDEINATSTSFSERGPTFSGTSSSLPTIDGVYDGSQGSDTLTVSVTRGGVVGLSPLLSLEVADGHGNTIKTLNLNFYQPDSAVHLSNGLNLTFGAGTLVSGDSFSIDMFESVGSAVNPINGTRNQNPNFDHGVNVVPGSFLVNGQCVAVENTDSINSVLAINNALQADVTAVFDSESKTTRQKIRGVSRHESEQFIRGLEKFTERFNVLYDDEILPRPPSQNVADARSAIQDSVSSIFGSSDPKLESGLGINFDFSQGTQKVIKIGLADSNQLKSIFRNDSARINALLFGNDDSPDSGLLPVLLKTIDSVVDQLAVNDTQRSALVDVVV